MFITVLSCFVVSICVECGLFVWVRSKLRRGEEWLGRVLNIPPTPDAPLFCTCGGVCFGLKERRQEGRLNWSV